MTLRRLRSLDALAIALFVLLFLFTWGDVLFTGAGVFQRDLTTYHYPMKKIVRETILAGDSPLWNPWYSGGQPMAANPAWEIFYPPQLLVLLPSFHFGYQLHIVLHLLLGGLGMYLLLRSLQLREWSALLGAVAFAFGGPMLSLVRLLPFLFSLTWMPWILLFVRRLLNNPNGRDFAAAAFFIGLQATVGEPTTLIQTWGLVAAYAIFRAWPHRKERREALRPILLAAGAGLAGVALAAILLLPAADFAGDTVRSEKFTFQLASHWSMPWKRPVEIFLPAFFRALPAADGQARLMSMYAFGDPFIGDFYFGLLPALLLLAALFVRPKHTWAMVAAVAVLYVIAVGKNTPLLSILYKAGVFDSIRYPEKFALGALLLLIVAAAVMFDRLASRDARTARVVFAFAVVWTGVAVVAALAASSSIPPQPESTVDWTVIGERAISQRTYWLLQLARGVFAIAMLFWLRKTKVRPEIWGAVVALLLVVDLRFLQDELARRMPREFFSEPDIARQLEKGAASRMFHVADTEWADASPTADAYMGDGRSQPWMIRNGLFPRTPPGWGIALALEEDFDETHLLVTEQLFQALAEAKSRGVPQWQEMFESMAAVRYRAVFRPFEPELQRVNSRRATMQPVSILPVGPWPRYSFASSLVPIRDRADLLFRAEHGWTEGTAFVEGEVFTPASGRVLRAEEHSPTEIAIDVETNGRALLVASITAHKYWRATIDRQPVAIRTVNLAFQGIEVPAGKHRVELRYRNPLIFAGAIISLLTAVCLAIIAFRWRGTPPLPRSLPLGEKPVR